MKFSPTAPLSVSFFFLAAAAASGQVNEDLKLTASDAAAGDLFGYATDTFGGRVVIGARGEDTAGNSSGAAYVYDATSGQELHKLTAEIADLGDLFGHAVAINDDVVLVGAWGENGDDDGVSFLTDSGSAYVFDIVTGQQLMVLKPDVPLSHARFGRSVALSGNLAVIGANGRDDQGVETGTAYVFDVTTGQQLHKLLATDSPLEGRLGESVAIDGNLIAVGATGVADNGVNSGAAYVFDATTGAQVAKLLPSDGETRDFFGEDVAISGNRVVVGAYADNDLGEHSGAAYVFDAQTGQELSKLLPSDGSVFDEFGSNVAIGGSRILISSTRDDVNGTDTGSVYVFDTSTGQELSKLESSDGAVQDFFGYGLSFDGATAAMGTPFNSDAGQSSGAAYLFEIDPGVTTFCAPVSPNSVSVTGALLTSSGGFGTAQATFDLANVPDSFGILFAGNSSTSVALGCGTRCVGGTIIRGAVVMPTGNQISNVPFDMSQPGATQIQYWFRDTGTCGSGTNLSNALR